MGERRDKLGDSAMAWNSHVALVFGPSSACCASLSSRRLGIVVATPSIGHEVTHRRRTEQIHANRCWTV
jgi:hypothetical protein